MNTNNPQNEHNQPPHQQHEQTNNSYINSSFENITSIKGSLVLLKKLQRVLQRETLSRSLDNKFLLIFHNYGLDLNAVQDIYEKCAIFAAAAAAAAAAACVG